MNDLNLRVSGGIGEKVKKPAAPITMPNWDIAKPGAANEFIKEFLNSKSADEQLRLLKQYLNDNRYVCNVEVLEFLVSLFWGADAKHPVKGFLKKHITESAVLREPFTKRLIQIISDEVKVSANLPYGHYMNVVSRLDASIDKFPPGAEAVSYIEMDVATYLLRCLESCITSLSNADESDEMEPLAPTEVNKIYDLAHLSLRLVLYMMQKLTVINRDGLSLMFGGIKAVTAELMHGKEVPMDTKSVSGIVALNLHLFENGPDSWVQLLNKEPSANGTVDLCMYSAIATAVPRPALLAAPGQPPALLELTDKVLSVGDRYSSDPSHALAVARTVLAISKALPLAPLALAAPLAARLAGYCWPQLDHHMDSVRHLAAQTMASVVAACVDVEKGGDPSALENLFTAVESLGDSRGAWAARTQLAAALGRRLRALRPGLPAAAAAALAQSPQQASAAIFLETLLTSYTQECTPETVYQEYLQVILAAARTEREPSALGVLERVLVKAVQWDARVLDYILPDRSQLGTYHGSDLKRILLVLGVVRKSGAPNQPDTFQQLAHTVYDANDEIRILALSLVSSAPATTEPLTRDELDFVLEWLRCNLNAQAPGFRQLMLAHMKKILRRLEDSLNITGQGRAAPPAALAAGASFYSGLLRLCHGSLVGGASFGRRRAALQLLAWARKAATGLAREPWTDEHAELIYNALEDTYESNKALALEILKDCHTELISTIEGPGDECLERLVRQASCVKPTESVSASYKLLLLFRRDGTVTLSADTEGYPERQWFCLLRRLLSELNGQAARAQYLLVAARSAPMFGLVHCINRALGCVDAEAIAGHAGWVQLVAGVMAACAAVAARAEPVASAASPEGLLPAAGGDAPVEGGRPVTAQMVLLFAWRSIKETSLLLGTLVSRLCLEGESPEWTLSAVQVEGIGAALAGLLARVRHRGGFEQAYVGFTMVLARLWQCRSAPLHQLPLRWFADVERDFLLPTPPEGAAEYCATRRGAGLPFMIQALVTTELAAESSAPRGRLLTRCMDLCLRAARAPASAEAAARAHLVLRALFRHTEPSAEATAAALMVAIKGADADTWMERNSSTLLFAALAVRVFGVPRRRAARTRMTGRIFFLRYPELYDFLLDQLQSANVEALRPSLMPTLLLLARLYPSALEGTVSNLKLERFLPLVVRLAGARDVTTRRLAARAAQPLVAPHAYMAHVQALFNMLGNPNIGMNLCHGILCQLSVLVEAPGAFPSDADGAWLPGALAATRRLAAAACAPAADQYLGALRPLLLRFPEPGFLDEQLMAIGELLSSVLFSEAQPAVASGREVYLANAALMYLLILTHCGQDINHVTMRCFVHQDYEVQLAALNYVLKLHGKCEESNPYLDHLAKITNADTLPQLQTYKYYMSTLSGVSKKATYPECAQKALRLLALTPECPETQHRLVRLKLLTHESQTLDAIIGELLASVQSENENFRLVYLDSLVELVTSVRVSREQMLPVLRALLGLCSAGAGDRERAAVARFLELKYAKLFYAADEGGTPEERFEVLATTLALAAILLEDDVVALRTHTAAAVSAAHATALLDTPDSALPDAAPAPAPALPGGRPRRVLAPYAARRLRAAAARRHPATLPLLAALDFRAAALGEDQLEDESRVFDQNETHNVYLEEFTWTVECAQMIKENSLQSNLTIDDYLAPLVNEHRGTIERLCIEDAIPCLTERKMSNNPKMDLFWKILDE